MNKSAFALVMISCLSLAIMPAVGDDYTLDIFGNANMDDTIDEDDIEYVEGIIDGTNDATELADANYDGEIDEDDITSIELIIREEEKELTIVDTADRIVTVTKPVERIICFDLYAYETMRSIKAKDKVVGVGTYIIKPGRETFFPEGGDLLHVGTSAEPDYEVILEGNPDVVILPATWSVSNYHTIQNKLNELDPGIQVIHLDLFKPESYLGEIKTLGYILDTRNESNEFIGFYFGWLDEIKERLEGLSDEDKPTVYFESQDPFGPWCTGSFSSGYPDKLKLAGCKNIFTDDELNIGESFCSVEGETVVERNPEIILKEIAPSGASSYDLDIGDTTEMEVAKEEILNRPELKEVSAVKDGNIYIISYSVMGGIRYLVGITYMAKWFHPDLFEDLNPKAKHQEYITRFQGLDYDLDKKGVFVYPEVS